MGKCSQCGISERQGLHEQARNKQTNELFKLLRF